MVLSRQYLQRMEIHWFIHMDTRKTCVSRGIYHTTSPDLLSITKRALAKASSGSFFFYSFYPVN